MSSSKSTYLLSLDTLKTIGQGALGAMTFGAYHQYTTNKIMEMNNDNIKLKHNNDMNALNAKFNAKFDKLENEYKLEKERKNKWW